MSAIDKLILSSGDEIPLHILPKTIKGLFDKQDKYMARLGRKPSSLWFYPKDIIRMNVSLEDKVGKKEMVPVTELVYSGIPIRKFEEGATEEQESLF